MNIFSVPVSWFGRVLLIQAGALNETVIIERNGIGDILPAVESLDK